MEELWQLVSVILALVSAYLGFQWRKIGRKIRALHEFFKTLDEAYHSDEGKIDADEVHDIVTKAIKVYEDP